MNSSSTFGIDILLVTNKIFLIISIHIDKLVQKHYQTKEKVIHLKKKMRIGIYAY